jgi:hypothetical protein
MPDSKPKRDEANELQHSIMIVPNFTYSPQEFYDTVEKLIAERKFPGLEISRVAYPQGGPLSNKRLYLRMIRERLAFEACATPFGVDYFFSCRTIYSPVQVKLWHVIVVLGALGLIYDLLMRPLGALYGGIALLSLVIAIAQLFQNTVSMALSDFDQFLLKIPAVSPIYERFFRRETYHRKDTRLAYLEIVPKLIEQLIQDITADKGVNLVRQYDRAPILGGLYMRKRREDD